MLRRQKSKLRRLQKKPYSPAVYNISRNVVLDKFPQTKIALICFRKQAATTTINRHHNRGIVPCGDYCVDTKEKLVEILYFRHFAKHFVFSPEGKNSRNKHLKNYFDVSVVVDMGGNTNEK